MLKKLVKYGNSNALVLDKALLELLDIEEGSIVKIKTDGKSLIITPQEKVEHEKVRETYTNSTASADFIANSYLNLYKNIDEARKKTLMVELKELLAHQRNSNQDLSKNAEFLKEWEVAAAQSLAKGASLAEHKKLYEDIASKYSSGQADFVQKVRAWETKNKLEMRDECKTGSPGNKNSGEDIQRFVSTYQAVKAQEALLLNNADYQHELQTIAEKYKNNQNSVEYIASMKELGYKYFPDLKNLA